MDNWERCSRTERTLPRGEQPSRIRTKSPLSVQTGRRDATAKQLRVLQILLLEITTETRHRVADPALFGLASSSLSCPPYRSRSPLPKKARLTTSPRPEHRLHIVFHMAIAGTALLPGTPRTLVAHHRRSVYILGKRTVRLYVGRVKGVPQYVVL